MLKETGFRFFESGTGIGALPDTEADGGNGLDSVKALVSRSATNLSIWKDITVKPLIMRPTA